MEKENTLQQCPAPATAGGENTRQTTGTENTAAARQPYEAPAVEVIEVQTERGYAGSTLPSNDPWNPGTW